MENYRRQLGVMYAGAYADDETFLVLYNFHWEKHHFLMAHPPVGKKWAVCIDTAEEEHNGMYPDGQEIETDNNEIVIEPRSIVVLKAIKDKSYKPKRRRKRKVKDITVSVNTRSEDMESDENILRNEINDIQSIEEKSNQSYEERPDIDI